MRYSEQLALVNRFRRSAPVDVEGLSFALGVPVQYAHLDPDISGLIEHTGNDRFRIVVNADHAKTRQRFTIAHELGHYMLHRHLIGNGVSDSRAYRSTNKGAYQNTNVGPKQETEANKFAVSLLMPDELIDQIKKQGHNSPAAQAKALGVSEQAYCIRVGIPYESTNLYAGILARTIESWTTSVQTVENAMVRRPTGAASTEK